MERAEKIKLSFNDKGTEEFKLYTNDEIIEKLEDLQSSLAAVIFEYTHAQCCRDREIVAHLNTLAADHGLDDSTLVNRLSSNIQQLGITIASLKKGKTGERLIQQALQLLELDGNVRILNNITLRDSTDQAEYDNIILAPYGIFVLEVKNYKEPLHLTETGYLENSGRQEKSYNIIGRMNGKELLLRRVLGSVLCQEQYHGIILLSNDLTPIVDDFHRIQVSYRNTIVKDIQSFDHGEVFFTAKQLDSMTEKLIALDQPQRHPCKVRCEEIISDFSAFMAQIENMTEEEDEEDQTDRGIDEHSVTNVSCEPHRKRFCWGAFWGGVATGAAALFLALTPVIFPSGNTRT